LEKQSWHESTTVRSPAEKPWLECGVVGDMPCEREKDKHLMLLSIQEKIDLPRNRFIQQVVVTVLTCL
jgi:hypothetical protein